MAPAVEVPASRADCLLAKPVAERLGPLGGLLTEKSQRQMQAFFRHAPATAVSLCELGQFAEPRA